MDILVKVVVSIFVLGVIATVKIFEGVGKSVNDGLKKIKDSVKKDD